MRRLPLLCALAAASGSGACTTHARDAIPLDLEPPAASYALGLARDEGLSVYAIDGDGAGAEAVPTFPAFAEDRPLELVVYAYDVPLARLGIAPGPLARAPSGGDLPTPARRAIRRVDASGSGAWVVDAGEVDARMESFRSSGLPLSPCVELASTTVELVGAADPIVALLPDREGVLALTGTPEYRQPGDGEIWRISSADPPVATRLDGIGGLDLIHAAGPIVSAVRGGDRRIWISTGGLDGVITLFVGTPEGGFTPLPRSPSSPIQWVWWMLVEARASGDRLWALTDHGSVHRFDDRTQTWTHLQGNAPHTYSDCISPTLRCGGLGRAPDGTIIIADPRAQQHVYRAQEDTLLQEPLPQVADPLTTMASTPLGVVVVRSSQLSTSFARRDAAGRWALMAGDAGDTAFMTQRTFGAIGWRDGFVASGRFGFVHQRAAEQFCTPVGGVAPNAVVSYLVELPDGLALANGWASDTGALPARVSVARVAR